MADESHPDIPVLTDAVDDDPTGQFPAEALFEPSQADTLIAELQTHLSASAFALTERLLQEALAEVETAVYERVAAELRQELPELIDRVLRRHLGGEAEPE